VERYIYGNEETDRGTKEEVRRTLKAPQQEAHGVDADGDAERKDLRASTHRG